MNRETNEQDPVSNENNAADTPAPTLIHDKWIETKREYEVDEFGNEKVKKITREIDKPKRWWERNKEALDTSAKLIGLITIAIPLVVIYYQQEKQNEREKANRQIDVYSNASIALHTFISEITSDTLHYGMTFNISYQMYPKILMLNDKSIISQYYSIKMKAENLYLYSNFINDLKWLVYYENNVFQLYNLNIGSFNIRLKQLLKSLHTFLYLSKYNDIILPDSILIKMDKISDLAEQQYSKLQFEKDTTIYNSIFNINDKGLKTTGPVSLFGNDANTYIKQYLDISKQVQNMSEIKLPMWIELDILIRKLDSSFIAANKIYN